MSITPISVGGIPIICNTKLTGLRCRSSQFRTSRDGVRGGQIIGMGSTDPADDKRIANSISRGQRTMGKGQIQERRGTGERTVLLDLPSVLCPLPFVLSSVD